MDNQKMQEFNIKLNDKSLNLSGNIDEMNYKKNRSFFEIDVDLGSIEEKKQENK